MTAESALALNFKDNWQNFEYKVPQKKELIKTVKFIEKKQEQPKSQNFEKKPESSTVSPFFDLDKSVNLYRKLVDIYGNQKGTELARKIFIKDIDSQLWELRETASSFQYRMYMINGRLVHESDLHNNTPLLDGVTDKIRRGKEKEQMVLLEQMLKELPIGSTILIPSPKFYARDEKHAECPYPDSILTRVTKLDENTYEGLQTMNKMEAPQMAELVNQLAGKQVIDPNSHIDKILLSLTQINKPVTDLEVIQAVEQITGQKILTKTPEEYAKEEQKFALFAKDGGTKLLEWINQGVRGEELVQKYTQMMSAFLKGVKSSKVHDDGIGGVWFDTSCGSFGNGALMRLGINGPEGLNGEKKMWCTSDNCKKENVCIGEKQLCNFCGAKLTDKKP